MPPDRVAPWKTWAAAVGLALWFTLAGLATWVTELNTIECGADPDRCEPAVRLASQVGIAAQIVVFALALAILIRAAARRELRPEHVVIPVVLSVTIVVVAWVAGRVAVDAQYGLEADGPQTRATAVMGIGGGDASRDPRNGAPPNAKMPPSSATSR